VQAAKCIDLAKIAISETVPTELRTWAEEFLAKADELEGKRPVDAEKAG
jgi:hypothetical protein